MTDPGREAGPPRLYNIPPGQSFVDALARGVLTRWGDDPLTLSGATILLPTRRACRALQHAFLRASDGRALLLPRMLPLGDLDADELLFIDEPSPLGAAVAAEIPPSIPALTRQLLLARLVRRMGETLARPGDGHPPSADQAVRLAGALARLLDQVETEGLGFDGLADLVPEEHARHWQEILKFLGIITTSWPPIQDERGVIGPAERRRRLAEAQAEAWARNPPAEPVIVAGSTGSIPATAALIKVVAQLPRGMVVLPGLDVETPAEDWRLIADDPTHPQSGLARLLMHLEATREDVVCWPETGVSATDARRNAFIATALAPAEATSGWHESALGSEARQVAESLRAVKRIDCPGPGQEATVIALLLRSALEDAGRTAALVTPDRGLARRVAAELGRWDIAIDDSAGTPLGATPPGAFLRLIARAAVSRLAPLDLLAVLKHPLAAGGQAPGTFRGKVRELEIDLLRGARPAPGLDGLMRALEVSDDGHGLKPWIEFFAGPLEVLANALAAGDRPLSALLACHVACAETLAASDAESGASRLWAGEAGEALAAFIDELRDASADAPQPDGPGYAEFLTSLLEGQVVRPRYGRHPRLAILGPLEARLQHADLVVLGGLNEGTWPGSVDPGPWMSRPMQADFGLPAPERRIGLAAHDFVQAFSAPRVYLTRATRVEGTPTVPSRWLSRLEALSEGLGLGDIFADPRWLDWAAALDRPLHPVFAQPPEPRPPLEARPRELSVTRVETWMRDPYGLYAEKILKLRALDPIDADPGAAEKGTLVHRALERFLNGHAESLPADPESTLIEIGEEVFRPLRARPGLWAFWWPRFKRLAAWFVAMEEARRGDIRRASGEVSGRLRLQGPGGEFIVTAKADRIDVLMDGELEVLDYKTGIPPREAEVKLGFAPQLPLEAAIAAAGGFESVPGCAVKRLTYWQLSGGDPAGIERSLKADPAELATDALAGLQTLIERFDDPATPYLARPHAGFAPRFSDYAHLARVKEWMAGDDEGSEGP
jgi:ATP-dependent helicase/nuclease subunit B